MWKNPTFKEVTIEKNNTVINKSGIGKAGTVVQMSLNELDIADVKVLILPFRSSWKNSNMDLEAFVIENTDNTYVIYIKDISDPRNIIKILTHECIHIKQYYNNTLHSDNGIVTWKDRTYKNRNLIHYMEYSTRPWERDAFNKGYDLSKKVKEFLLEK